MLFGALTVLNVIIAIEMLDAGPDGVGYLLALCGVGSVAGGLVVLARVGRKRVATDMAVGVIGWALPFLLLAAYPRCRPRCSRCWSSGSWTRGSTSASTPCRSGWPRSG